MSETHTGWKSAKADAQGMELEIASLIPASSIVSVTQKPTGILFPCSETQHTWYGSTTTLLAPGSDVEELAETYIFGKTDADTIRIDSGSVCFTLPEGAYPDGKF